MRTLYPKLLVLVVGVFTIVMVAIVLFVNISSRQQMEREWLARAETMNRIAFEALYANLAHGGGLEGNRQVIARLEEMGVFTGVRVIKGDPVIQQFGHALDEPPQDELEQRALQGEEVGVIVRRDGYRVVRYVTPLRIEEGCQSCHQAAVGEITGVISTEISLQDYELALHRRQDILFLTVGGGILVLGLLTFYALRRLVLQPLDVIQRGTAAIAGGNLDHRLEVHTGDELEGLANEFNLMSQRLQESYGTIAQEQNRIMTAIEASRDAIWISGADRRVVLVNSAMERLLGKSRAEMVGRACHELLCIHDAAGSSVCEAGCSFLQSNAENGRIEGYISAASGQEIWVEVSYGRVNDSRGRLVGGVHIVHDLTQRKEVEQLKDEFIATVSHELRTPLNHIKGFATTLLQTDVVWDEPAQRDFLGSINREADRLTNLVEKILHLSRLETAGFPLEREWWQVNELIDGALQRRRGTAAERQVQLDLASDLPTLWVDGREIEVVLMNLLENACKYAHPGTPITLSTELKPDRIDFCVADQGPGIAPEYLDLIFERFYRVDGDKYRAPGTGLGLAICKRIVEAHGGSIWVESQLQVGSRFCFSLPLEAADRPVDSPAARSSTT